MVTPDYSLSVKQLEQDSKNYYKPTLGTRDPQNMKNTYSKLRK